MNGRNVIDLHIGRQVFDYDCGAQALQMVLDAGVVTVRAGLTMTAGGLMVTAGGITVTAGTSALQAMTATTGNFSGVVTLGAASPLSLAATSKFVVGATAFTVKDSGDRVTAFGISGTGASSAVSLACGGSSTLTLTGPNATLLFSSNNIKATATSGKMPLGTDGTNPLANSVTAGLPAIPHTATAPNGALGTGYIGALFYEPGDSKVWIWSGTAWKSITTS